jgi:hypothetical protein
MTEEEKWKITGYSNLEYLHYEQRVRFMPNPGFIKGKKRIQDIALRRLPENLD